jgi:predicted DNA binding CopG/RHH family protein
MIRIIGAGYWRRGKQYMNSKTRYTDEPLGDVQVIPDFLPSPEELAFREDSVKVTLTLSRSSVAFFKNVARKHHTPYQKMIRRLLDAYAAAHQQGAGNNRHRR